MENKRFYVKDEGPGFQGFETVEKKSSKRPKVIIIFLLLVIVLAGLLYMGYQYMSMKQEKSQPTAPTPSPTVTLEPTNTPIASGSGTPELSTTPKASGTVTPKPSGKAGSDTEKRSKISVSVLNGSGTPGAAGKISSYLKGLGYTIVATGNADAFDYTDVTVNTKKGNDTVLSLLKADLSKDYTVKTSSSPLPASNTADAVVIVGK